MPRAIPLIAVLCTGLALGGLIAAIAVSGRGNQHLPDEVEPLDPMVAMPEIAELRQSRGSILAGTSLAASDDHADFSAALASQTGTEPPPTQCESLVDLLRRSASDYEQHAQRLESSQDYSQADELRRLAENARKVARSFSDHQQ
jgi:hypothetical protein